LPITKKDFVNRLRDSLPHKYRTLSDDAILKVTQASNPGFLDKIEFKREPAENPGFVGGFIEPIREQVFRGEQTAAALGNIYSDAIGGTDELKESARKWYKSASHLAELEMQNDKTLSNYRQWAGENPFEWGEFFTNPAMFSSTISSVASSMAVTIGAGATAGLLTGGNPVAAFAASAAAGGALEASDAYREAEERARKKGYSEEKIQELAAESGLMYGVIAGALESIVPFSVTKSLGLVGKNAFGDFSAKFLREATEAGAANSSEIATKAFSRLAQENLGIYSRVKGMIGATGLDSGTEALTEAVQFLSQKGIIDYKVDNREIDGEWFKEAVSDPQFHQSIAGGLFGGAGPSGAANVAKQFSKDGEKAAKAYLGLVKDHDLNDPVKATIFNEFLKKLDGFQKAKFVEQVGKGQFETLSPKVKEVVEKTEESLTETPEDQPQSTSADLPTEESSAPVEPVTKEKPKVEKAPTKEPEKPTLEEAIAEPPKKEERSPVSRMADPEEKAVGGIPGKSNREKLAYYFSATTAADKEYNALPGHEKKQVLAALGSVYQEANIPEDLLKKNGEWNEELIFNVLKWSRRNKSRPTVFFDKNLGSTGGKIRFVEGFGPAQAEYQLDAEDAFGAKELAATTDLPESPKAKASLPKVSNKRTGKFVDLDKVSQLAEDHLAVVGEKYGYQSPEIRNYMASVEEAKKDFKKNKNPDRYLRLIGALTGVENLDEYYKADTRSNKKSAPVGDTGDSKTGAKPVKGKQLTAEQAQAALLEDDDDLPDAPANIQAAEGSSVADSGADSVVQEVGLKTEAAKKEGARIRALPKDEKLKTIEDVKSRAESEWDKFLNQGNKKHNADLAHYFVEVVEYATGNAYDFDANGRLTAHGIKESIKNEILIDEIVDSMPGFRDHAEDFQLVEPESLREDILLEMLDKDGPAGLLVKKFLDMKLENKINGVLYYNGKIGPNGKEIPGFYNSIHKILAFNQNVFEMPSPKGLDVEVVLHELTHLITHDRFFSDKKFQKKIKALHKHTRDWLAENRPGWIEEFNGRFDTGEVLGARAHYLMSNPEEFLAGALSSPSFQELLSGVEYRAGKSVWQELLDIIKDVLGIKSDDNVLSEVINEIFSESKTVEPAPDIDIQGFEDATTDDVPESTSNFTEDENAGFMVVDTGGVRGKDSGTNVAATTYYMEQESKEPETDDRDGSMEVENVISSFEKSFFAEYGVYLSKDALRQMYEVAKANPSLNLGNVDDIATFSGLVATIIKKEAGKDINLSDQRVLKKLKDFYQKGLSKVRVYFKGSGKRHPDHRFRLQLVLDEDWQTGTTTVNRIEELEETQLQGTKKNPDMEPQNFIEYDQINNGIANRLFYLSLKRDVYINKEYKGKKYVTPGGIGDFNLSPESVQNLNKLFAKEWHTYNKTKGEKGVPHLKFFLGEVAGDNSQALFSAITGKLATITTEQAFLEYMAKEVAAGTIPSVKVLKEMANDIRPLARSNPYAWAQAIGWHAKMKSIKGNGYLAPKRYKSVSDFFKRLKLDLGKGWVPVGSGPTKMMVVNANEVEFFHNGTKFEHMRNAEDSAHDGWMMTSAKLMDRWAKVSGVRGNPRVWKTVIRHLDPDNRTDYIAAKMLEMVPFKNTEVRKDGKRIAIYKNGTWRDANGKEFDRLATNDEVKDSFGALSAKYEILPELPESSTRVLFVGEKSSKRAANPVAGYELTLSKGFMENSEAAREYLKTLTSYINRTARKYSDFVFGLKNRPQDVEKLIKKHSNPDEVPTDLQAAFKASPKAAYLYQYATQMLNTLQRSVIIDKMFKMRRYNDGLGTKLYLKPAGPIQFKDNKSVVISGDNATAMNMVSTHMVENGAIDPEVLESMDVPTKIATYNKYLAENDVWVLIHRQPIQSFAKVQPRKIQYFTNPGEHGQVVFMTKEDVFQLHEADHDGDSVHIEYFNKEDAPVLDAMNNMIQDPEFAKKDKTVNLSLFLKGVLGNRIHSASERLARLANNTKSLNSQGVIVNAKTALATMAYKDISGVIEIKEGPKNKKVSRDIKFEVYQPEEPTIMDYWSIDTKYLDTEDGKKFLKQLLQEGDSIETVGSKAYLKTTKEHEFSIMLQAAVDNEKFGLIGSLDFATRDGRAMSFTDFVMTRMFKRPDLGKNPVPGAWTSTELQAVKKVYEEFKYSADRKGMINGKNVSIDNIIKRSYEIGSRYFTLPNKDGVISLKPVKEVASNLRDGINNRLNSNRAVLKSLNANNKVTPIEYLMSNLGLSAKRQNLNNMENGISLTDNPIIMDKDFSYWAAHADAVQAMEPFLIEQPGAETKESVSGLKFGDEMYGAFNGVFAKMMKDLESKNLTKQELRELGFKLDYNEIMRKEFLEVWFPKWEALSDMEQRWATIRILTGPTFSRGDGKRSKVAKLKTIPPAWMMHPEVLAEYANGYYDNLYKARRETSIGKDDVRLATFGKILNRIEGRAYCG